MRLARAYPAFELMMVRGALRKTYDEPETGYFLEGEVTGTGEDGETAQVAQGDLVTFPAGMSCRWKITQDGETITGLGELD